MLYLNSAVAAFDTLRSERLPLTVGHAPHAKNVLLLNIMPLKCVTEEDLCRMLAASGIDINLTLIKIPGQTYKTTSQEYVDTHYVDFDENMMQRFTDGLIITGAPLENMDFEAVNYWPQLCTLMEWSKTHSTSTLNICWAAQAALYYHYGVRKHPLADKMFGIFPQTVFLSRHPLMQDLGNTFPMPHSRHTEVRSSELPKDVAILAGGGKTGLGLLADDERRQVFAVGHLEYEPFTLDKEYRRDLSKGLPILPPENYYLDNKPDHGVNFSWREAALTFYRNWAKSL